MFWLSTSLILWKELLTIIPTTRIWLLKIKNNFSGEKFTILSQYFLSTLYTYPVYFYRIYDRSYQRASNHLVLLASLFRSISYFWLIHLDNLDLLSSFLKQKSIENLTLFRSPFYALPLDSFLRNLCGSFSIKKSFIF